jgi:predicted small secreted protein
MKRKSALIMLALLTALFLAACGGDNAGTDAGADSGSDTEPAAEESVTLSESVTSNDGITVSYPAGWEDPIADIGIFVYNNASAASGIMTSRMDEGNIYVQISKTPMNREPAEQLEFSLSNLAVETGETTDIENGVMTTGTGENIAILGAVITVTDDTGIVFVGYSNPAELEANRDLFMQMIESLSYDEDA